MNKTIEVLEKRQKYLKQRIDLGNWGIGREKLSLKKEYKTELNALSTAIQVLKALDQAEKELGGKKAPFKCCKCGFEGWTSSHDVCLKCGEAVYRVSLENEGYNRMHDIAKPIIAQRDLRISELMKSEYQARANYGDLFSDFKQDEQELQTLKDKLTVDKLRHILATEALRTTGITKFEEYAEALIKELKSTNDK